MSGGGSISRGLDLAATGTAVALCLAFLVALLVQTCGDPRPTEDTLQNAILARNLARDGTYRIHIIQYNVGSFESVSHVPEMHGFLQPLLLTGLFAWLGPQDDLLRLPGLVAVAATGLTAFFLSRSLFGTLAGLAACALVLQSRLLTRWAIHGTDDAAFAFLFAATMALALRAARVGGLCSFAVAGLVGGLAVVQKPIGVLLPVVLLGAVWPGPGATWRLAATRWLALAAPGLVAVAAYLARNFVAHGSLSFRWGAIDWLYKSRGISAYQHPYDVAPGLFEVLGQLGPAEVARIIGHQLADFFFLLFPYVGPVDRGASLLDPSVVTPLALAALVPLFFSPLASQRRFAGLAGLSLAGSVALVCGVSHFEERYFLLLVPLLAVSFSGLLARLHALDATGAARAAARVTALASVAALVASAIAAFDRGPRAPPPAFDRCADAVEWVRRNTHPDARILTIDPWRVTWATDRPAIVLPSGGVAQVEKIMARYRPRWLFLYPWHRRQPTLAVARAMMEHPASPHATEPAFRGRSCTVYPLGR